MSDCRFPQHMAFYSQKPSVKSQRPSSDVEVASSIPVYTSRPISLQEQQSQQVMNRHQLNNPVTQSSSAPSSSDEKVHSSKLPVTPDKRRSESRESHVRDQQSPQTQQIHHHQQQQRPSTSPAINRGNRNSVQETVDSTSHVTGIAQRLLFPALNEVSYILPLMIKFLRLFPFE